MTKNLFPIMSIIDLGGNIRKNPKLSGPTHNVFAIQTGVAIAFFVKEEKKGKTPARIFYTRRDEMELATEKLSYLRNTKFEEIKFESIKPDKNNNWINLTENDWDDLIPVASKEGKNEKGIKEPKTIFKFYSTGISTNRDEWIVDVSKEGLELKMSFFVQNYSKQLSKDSNFDTTLKWSRNLKKRFERKTIEDFSEGKIQRYSYRPFGKFYLYYSDLFVDEMGIGKDVEPENDFPILAINISEKRFACLSSNYPMDLHFVGDNQCLPLYRYAEDGTRVENITDWALSQFQKQYKDKKITKENIFHYVYAVLHHPAYRTKYEINLKREFPRIPFYENFGQWSEWGKQLIDLHLNYEKVEPFGLKRLNVETLERSNIQTKLMARKEKGEIEIDTQTTLTAVPAEAWEYRLGTYSALEWILERYKEKKSKDPTIAEKFNTYKFSDYREHVIDLLQRVCTVSVETMKIVKEMPE